MPQAQRQSSPASVVKAVRASKTPLRRSDPPPPPAPDLGFLGDAVGFHLRIAQTLAFQNFAREAGTIDVSPGYFALLVLIGNNPGINQTKLSQANGRDKSSLTPVLTALEERGLIKRSRVLANRRTYSLQLTPKGETTRKRLQACAERHENTINAILGQADAEELVRLLKHLSAGLQTMLT